MQVVFPTAASAHTRAHLPSPAGNDAARCGCALSVQFENALKAGRHAHVPVSVTWSLYYSVAAIQTRVKGWNM